MSSPGPEINHVSDTALLVAGARAIESERPDSLVTDPFAARLAGERGKGMFDAVPHPEVMGFGIAIRTRFIDELLQQALAATGSRTVLSVGAGLDTRPWRLALPPDLRWIEVDFPAMLDYKEALLSDETPRCRRERLTADLNDPAQRPAIYAAAGTAPAILITEGLLLYLPAGTVEALATEVRRQGSITLWISEITTSTFAKAIGGDGKRVIGHVQAEDHLEGEQILETLYRAGWTTSAHRSYIRDLGFAMDRIRRMMAGHTQPAPPPAFAPDEPAGVHQFTWASPQPHFSPQSQLPDEFSAGKDVARADGVELPSQERLMEKSSLALVTDTRAKLIAFLSSPALRQSSVGASIAYENH